MTLTTKAESIYYQPMITIGILSVQYGILHSQNLATLSLCIALTLAVRLH